MLAEMYARAGEWTRPLFSSGQLFDCLEPSCVTLLFSLGAEVGERKRVEEDR